MSLLKKKAAVLSREMANHLSKRLPALIVLEGVDASGNPTILISDGTAATTEQNFFIRTIEMPSLGLDSVGGAQQSYGPHVVQVAMETSTVAALGFPTDANRLQVMGEVCQTRCRVEIYLSANGTVPTVATITGANLVGTFEDLYFAPIGNM